MMGDHESRNANWIMENSTGVSLSSEEDDHRARHGEEGNDEKELQAMKQHLQNLENEAAKLREFNETAAAKMNEENATEEDKAAADARSIYVGNVDYGATPEEIHQHFSAAGTINRVTILCDKHSGHPKGYAYVEFAEPSLIEHALKLNDSLFRGRLITVVRKRTNVPGMKRGRGRGGYRGGYNQRGFNPYSRGRGRSRGRAYY